MAPERSGSAESNGEKKKPSRKISRFLVSPVVDRGENLPEETPIPEIEKSEEKKAKENGLPEAMPQDNYVPTHQYSSSTQAPLIDHRLEMRPDPEAEVPAIPQSVSMLNATALQPNLTTPLQIATDTPLLGELDFI